MVEIRWGGQTIAVCAACVPLSAAESAPVPEKTSAWGDEERERGQPPLPCVRCGALGARWVNQLIAFDMTRHKGEP